MDFFSSQQRYYCPLPPTALVRRLQQIIQPRPTGWRGWAWRLGFFHPTCWGEVHPATRTFTARVPTSRSEGPLIRGRWQPAPDDLAAPVAGILVELHFQTPGSEIASGVVVVLLFGGILSWALSQPALTIHRALAMALGAGLLTLLFFANIRRTTARAQRYLQQSLSLHEAAG